MAAAKKKASKKKKKAPAKKAPASKAPAKKRKRGKKLAVGRPRTASKDYKPGIMGKRVKALRNKKGWTQEMLAVKSQIPQNALSKLETGFNQFIQPADIRPLARALGTTADYLLGGKNVSK